MWLFLVSHRHQSNKEGREPAIVPYGLSALDLGQSRMAPAAVETDEHVNKFVTTRKTLGRLVFGGSSSVSEPPAEWVAPTPSSPTSSTTKIIADKASHTVKEILTSKRDKNHQRLLELRHELGLNGDEIVYQVGFDMDLDKGRRSINELLPFISFRVCKVSHHNLTSLSLLVLIGEKKPSFPVGIIPETTPSMVPSVTQRPRTLMSPRRLWGGQRRSR